MRRWRVLGNTAMDLRLPYIFLSLVEIGRNTARRKTPLVRAAGLGGGENT